MNNLKKIKKHYPELFEDQVDKRHEEIMKKNPDLHAGHAVGYDGSFEEGKLKYPEFKLHRASDMMRYLPEDNREDVIRDSGVHWIDDRT